MSENEFNSVPIRQPPQLETLVSSQAVTALQKQLTAAQLRVEELESAWMTLLGDYSSDYKALTADNQRLRELLPNETQMQYLGKAASALRFGANEADWGTAEARAELRRIADSITDFCNAVSEYRIKAAIGEQQC